MIQLENVAYSLSSFCELSCWLFRSDRYLICQRNFFLAMNSASLWDLNYRLVLNFVLFLHQLGWPQRLFCLSQHMVQAQEYSFQNVFLGCVNNCGRALGTQIWRSYVEDLIMVLFRGNSSSYLGISSNSVRKKITVIFFLYLYILLYHSTENFLISFGLFQ